MTVLQPKLGRWPRCRPSRHVLSPISTGRWPSRSASTPSVTTGPGPLTPTPWWRGSSPPARGPTCSTSAAGPESRRGSSGRRAAGCWGSSPTRGWLTSPGGPGSRLRWRRSRPGIAPGGRSTRSWPAKPGTGWIRSREPLRRSGRCGRVAGWPRSGTCSSPRPRWRRPSPRPSRGWCPTRRSTCGRRPTGSRRASRAGPPTGCGRRPGSATRSGGSTTGSGPTPATNGSSTWPRPAASPRLRPVGERRYWRPSAPPWTRASRCASRP